MYGVTTRFYYDLCPYIQMMMMMLDMGWETPIIVIILLVWFQFMWPTLLCHSFIHFGGWDGIGWGRGDIVNIITLALALA